MSEVWLMPDLSVCLRVLFLRRVVAQRLKGYVSTSFQMMKSQTVLLPERFLGGCSIGVGSEANLSRGWLGWLFKRSIFTTKKRS